MAKKIEEKQAEEVKPTPKLTAKLDCAVISLGGKQYLVKPNDKLLVEKLDLEIGKTIKLADILAGKEVVVKHLELQKGKKISIWKFKNKTRRLKRMGHRQNYSKIEVESVK